MTGQLSQLGGGIKKIGFIIKSIPLVLEIIFVEEKEAFFCSNSLSNVKIQCLGFFSLSFSLPTLLCIPNRGSVSKELGVPGWFWPCSWQGSGIHCVPYGTEAPGQRRGYVGKRKTPVKVQRLSHSDNEITH